MSGFTPVPSQLVLVVRLTQVTVKSLSRSTPVNVPSSCSTGTSAEHRPSHHAATSRIIVVEAPAHQLPSGVQALDRKTRLIQHALVSIHAQAAEGKSEAAGDR